MIITILTCDIVTYDYETNDVIICWALAFIPFSFTAEIHPTSLFLSRHRHWILYQVWIVSVYKKKQNGPKSVWWAVAIRLSMSMESMEHVTIVFHIEFRLLWFLVAMLSIIIAWNVTAYACYTFECKIIRNVYMAHRYPSAIRHLYESLALFRLGSLLSHFSFRVFFFFYCGSQEVGVSMRTSFLCRLLCSFSILMIIGIRVVWYRCSGNPFG